MSKIHEIISMISYIQRVNGILHVPETAEIFNPPHSMCCYLDFLLIVRLYA